jgi:hypothetical protein
MAISDAQRLSIRKLACSVKLQEIFLRCFAGLVPAGKESNFIRLQNFLDCFRPCENSDVQKFVSDIEARIDSIGDPNYFILIISTAQPNSGDLTQWYDLIDEIHASLAVKIT